MRNTCRCGAADARGGLEQAETSKTKSPRRPPSLIYLEVTGAAPGAAPRRMRLCGDRLQTNHRDLAIGLLQIAAVARRNVNHFCVCGFALSAFQHIRANLDPSIPNLEPSPVWVLAQVDEPVRVRR